MDNSNKVSLVLIFHCINDDLVEKCKWNIIFAIITQKLSTTKKWNIQRGYRRSGSTLQICHEECTFSINYWYDACSGHAVRQDWQSI